MGYYDGTDLNYYYALASMFATSDSWFAPVMTRTPPNREFLIAGTSNGYVYQRGANPPLDSALLPQKTIFEMLQAKGISWKIYVNPFGTSCQNTPTDVACLVSQSYIHDFAFGNTIKNNPSAYTNNIVPISQFYTDAVNGTLPAVSQIEPASSAGLDEHPEDNDPTPGQPARSPQGRTWCRSFAGRPGSIAAIRRGPRFHPAGPLPRPADRPRRSRSPPARRHRRTR